LSNAVWLIFLSFWTIWVQNGGMIRGLAVLAALTGLAAYGSPAALVDLNRASVAELMHVPGMTATWAARIVRFRPYRSKLDLVQDGVVTPEVYRRIRDGVVAHRVELKSEHR
jgi:DNA uptake protein ComE-like DNA-binding protein